MPPTLKDIETLARQAGEILRAGYIPRPGYELRHEINYKGVIDPVTETDHKSEAFLLGEIQRRFPEDRILAEESGDLAGTNHARWYVDPLDGTVNFAHGVPVFCVSLAYARDGQLQLGAVYDPMQDECFSAERGRGAWLNGSPIRVSAAVHLDQCLLATGFPYNIRTIEDTNLENYARFSLRSQGVRRLGSAALDLCYVAAGRLDGYWELYLQPWDMAAGALIALEAGATVTTARGGPDLMTPPYSALAANPVIHAQMLEVLRGGL
jgi:myo-inositol-1(or 4)-monophosphatase